jgi:ribosomal protein S18 acetylase RimI-like enzyme
VTVEGRTRLTHGTAKSLGVPIMDTEPFAVSLVSGGPELLDRVERLWHQLRHHHADLDPRWRDGLLAATFDGRKSHLIEKSVARGGAMLVLLAVNGEGGDVVGYCVCTVSGGGDGEVDSLFVAPDHRRRGVGHALMSRATEWLTDRRSKTISVEVMTCNESAIRLYERYGFHPRTVRMRHVGRPQEKR